MVRPSAENVARPSSSDSPMCLVTMWMLPRRSGRVNAPVGKAPRPRPMAGCLDAGWSPVPAQTQAQVPAPVAGGAGAGAGVGAGARAGAKSAPPWHDTQHDPAAFPTQSVGVVTQSATSTRTGPASAGDPGFTRS
jgi:hypothetical protein